MKSLSIFIFAVVLAVLSTQSVNAASVNLGRPDLQVINLPHCSGERIGNDCAAIEITSKGKTPCEVCTVRFCNTCFPHSGEWTSPFANYNFYHCVKDAQIECSEL